MIQRLRFYSVVIVPGAVLMALEIVSSRVLAPQFGSSVYVWGSIIGIFLAAMSVGYVWGGKLADLRPDLASLGELLIGAAAAQAVVLLFGRQVVEILGDWTGGAPWGTLLATSVLFGAPTVLLATVAPYVVRLAARDLDVLGGTAGHLYALSTGGSLLGTLGATFVLIPYLELEAILRLLLTVTVLTGALALGFAWREKRLATALGLAVLVLGLSQGFGTDLGGTVLANRMTPYQTLQVYEQDGVRYMQSDGTLHAALDLATGEPWLIYPRTAAGVLLFDAEIDSLLVLGMGGGSLGGYLGRQLPDLAVDFVDIDTAVPELAAAHMGFVDDERTEVHVDDARRFLQESNEVWDFIYADTYIGHSIPFHLSTLEFFREIQAHLTSDGLLGVNLISGPGTPFGASFLRSVNQIFPQIYLFNVPGGNYFLLASNRTERLSAEELVARGRELDQRFDFDPTLTQIAGFLNRGFHDLSNAQVLRDKFAPVNHLLFQKTKDDGDSE